MKNSTKLILWKIYFWFILINVVITYILQGFSRLWVIADLFIYFIAFVGLFAFIWKKNILNKLFWKTYFFVQIIWNIFYLYFLPLPEKITESFEMSQFSMATISIIIYIPLFFALYLYGFKFKNK